MLLAHSEIGFFLPRPKRSALALRAVFIGGALCVACNAENPAQSAVRASVLWRTSVSEFGGTPDAVTWFGRPAVDSGLVFFEAGSSLAAADVATGTRRWSTALRVNRELGTGNLIADRGELFAVRQDSAFSLNYQGGVRWLVETPGAIGQASPALSSRYFFIGTRTHRVIALSRTDGRVAWTTDIGPQWGWSSDVRGLGVSGDTVYAIAKRELSETGVEASGVIVALSASTGSELWRYETTGTGHFFFDSPAFAGDIIVVADPYGRAMQGIDRFTKASIWSVMGDAGSFGPRDTPVIAGDTVYGGFADRYLYAADVKTGQVLWTTMTPASITNIALCNSTLLANNQQVEVFDRRGRRYRPLLDLDDNDRGFGIPTSGFGVAGGIAVVVGTRYVTGIRCEPR